jgi:tRNA(Arg) A34 adenosine deaminase TadA
LVDILANDANITKLNLVENHKVLTRDLKMMQFVRRQSIDVEPMANSKIAASVVIKGQIIAVGCNRNQTHPMQAKYSKNSESIYLHAELSAIVKSLNHINKDDFKNSTMFIYRVKRPCSGSSSWVDGLAKPCSGCMSAISAFNIKKVIYSTDDNGQYGTIDRFCAD